MIVSTWGVAQRQPARVSVATTERDATPEGESGSENVALNHEAARRPRKRPYPRQALKGGFSVN
jgi:hypothetical protein